MTPESIENSLVKKLEKKKVYNDVEPSESENTVSLTEKEIQLIAECAIAQIKNDLGINQPHSDVLDGYFKVLEHDILEPKKKVIKQKEFSIGVKIAGLVLIGLCVAMWIYFFFIIQNYEPLTYTTYFTIILIGLTCLNKFESVLFNSITCMTVYGMFSVAFWLIPVVNDVTALIVGPIVHGAIACFQLYLILHRKIPMSKRYLVWGFLFYLIFLSSYDQFGRLNLMAGVEEVITDLNTEVHFLYTLVLSVMLIYLYKKKYGILLP